MLLLITEEELESIDLIIHVTNLLNTEEMSSLFSLEEETSVLNSVRTQVQQAGLSFSRAVAWEFFLRYVLFFLTYFHLFTLHQMTILVF
jgi:dynein heavy chain